MKANNDQSDLLVDKHQQLKQQNSERTLKGHRGVSQPMNVKQRLGRQRSMNHQAIEQKSIVNPPQLDLKFGKQSDDLESFKEPQSPYDKNKKYEIRPLKDRLQSYIELSVPAVASYFFVMLQEQVDVIFVAYFNDTTQIAAIGLRNMVINIWCLSFLFGINTALETLVSQAFGRGNLKECGISLYKAILLISLMFLPIVGGVTYMAQILKFFGMDADASDLATGYVWAQLPGILLHAYADSINLTLAAMGYTYITAVIQVMIIPCHVACCWFFTQYWGYGIIGICYAFNVTSLISLWVMTIYAMQQKEVGQVFVYPELSKILQNLKEFIWFALPGIVMLFLDWANWEVLVLMAGQFQSNDLLSIMVVICAIGNIFIMVPTGMSVAAVAQVGNALGRNKHREAQADAKMVLQLACVLGLGTTFGMAIFRDRLLMIYFDEKEFKDLHEEAASVLLFYSFGFFFDWLQNNACGLIKAASKQREASIASLIGMVAIGFPISYWCGIHLNYGLKGLWCGYLFQNISCAACYLYIIQTLNWEATAEKASNEEDNLTLYESDNEIKIKHFSESSSSSDVKRQNSDSSLFDEPNLKMEFD